MGLGFFQDVGCCWKRKRGEPTLPALPPVDYFSVGGLAALTRVRKPKW